MMKKENECSSLFQKNEKDMVKQVKEFVVDLYMKIETMEENGKNSKTRIALERILKEGKLVKDFQIGKIMTS